jgi:hypothetical protein
MKPAGATPPCRLEARAPFLGAGPAKKHPQDARSNRAPPAWKEDGVNTSPAGPCVQSGFPRATARPERSICAGSRSGPGRAVFGCSFGGHEHVAVLAGNKPQHRAFRKIAGVDRRLTRIAPLQRVIPQVKTVPTLLFFRPVTGHAVVPENRKHFS